MWCNVVHPSLDAPMAAKDKNRKAEPQTVRASVSFPRELYQTLGLIAKQKKVTVAWIVRDAAEKYVGEQWPLLK